MRRKADIAEKRSFEKAREGRVALSEAESKDEAERQKLRDEFRQTVNDAFLARRDLHFMEYISFSKNSQAMARKLRE